MKIENLCFLYVQNVDFFSFFLCWTTAPDHIRATTKRTFRYFWRRGFLQNPQRAPTQELLFHRIQDQPLRVRRTGGHEHAETARDPGRGELGQHQQHPLQQEKAPAGQIRRFYRRYPARIHERRTFQAFQPEFSARRGREDRGRAAESEEQAVQKGRASLC